MRHTPFRSRYGLNKGITAFLPVQASHPYSQYGFRLIPKAIKHNLGKIINFIAFGHDSAFWVVGRSGLPGK